MSAVVRPATPADVDAVLDLWGVARTAAAVTEDTPEAVSGLIEHDPGALLVAEVDGLVVGALVAAWDGWRGNVYRLAVLPEHRRRGIGRALAEEGHRRLRERGRPARDRPPWRRRRSGPRLLAVRRLRGRREGAALRP